MDTAAVMPRTDDSEIIAYKDSTYELVSKVAYLIGVPKRIFENEHEAPQLEIYEQLEKKSIVQLYDLVFDLLISDYFDLRSL